MNLINPTLDSDFSCVITLKTADESTYINPTDLVIKFHIKTEYTKDSDIFTAVYNPYEMNPSSIFFGIENKFTELVDYELEDGTIIKAIMIKIPSFTFKMDGYLYVKTELLSEDSGYPDGIENTLSIFIRQNVKYIDYGCK